MSQFQVYDVILQAVISELIPAFYTGSRQRSLIYIICPAIDLSNQNSQNKMKGYHIFPTFISICFEVAPAARHESACTSVSLSMKPTHVHREQMIYIQRYITLKYREFEKITYAI